MEMERDIRSQTILKQKKTCCKYCNIKNICNEAKTEIRKVYAQKEVVETFMDTYCPIIELIQTKFCEQLDKNNVI